MKKLILSTVAVVSGFCAFGQQDYQLSQFMYDRLSINPGYAGIDNQICATGIFRNQWSNFDGAPTTFLFNVHGPVPMLRGGAGLSVFSDKIGFFSNTTLKLSYSYHLAIGNGDLLGIGLSVGYMSLSLDPTWIAITAPNLDNAIPDEKKADSAMDFGFGLYYKGKNYYAGLSATHLSESDLTDLNVQNARHYFVLAGYDHPLGSSFVLRPSTRIESDGTSTQADINFNVLWNSMAWLGFGYRVKDALVPMFGFQQKVGTSGKMPGMVRIGYSYDVTTSDIKNYSSGSHEIMVGYCFNVVIPPTVQKSKTVRFL
jgi:type IX secretion system PorP/SprF family membrane protein